LIPFTVTDVPLRPLTQVAGFLGSGVPVFDIRDVDSGPDLLIANGEQASALARSLGDHAVVLLRGHGAVVVANSLQQLVWRGIYAELNAASSSRRCGSAAFDTCRTPRRSSRPPVSRMIPPVRGSFGRAKRWGDDALPGPNPPARQLASGRNGRPARRHQFSQARLMP
jgi:hypothetical protein